MQQKARYFEALKHSKFVIQINVIDFIVFCFIEMPFFVDIFCYVLTNNLILIRVILDTSRIQQISWTMTNDIFGASLFN